LKQIRKSVFFPILTKLADYKQYGEKMRKQFEASMAFDKIFCSFLLRDIPLTDLFKSRPFMR
jgi:hypothetical protein